MNSLFRRAEGARLLFSRRAFQNRGLTPPARQYVWCFVALALLALPLFAHGCHGDDIDHEPLLIPLRLTSEDR